MNEELLAPLRREAAIVCDRDGRVEWADAAAARLLGIGPGSRLRDCAPGGMAAHLDTLLARAADGPIDRFEACVRVDGRAVTMAFTARPAPGGIALVGSLAPDDFAGTLQHVTDAMTELGTLQRQSERQQRDLQRRNDELLRLNRELDDASRGMRTLYADVQEKAAALQRLSDVRRRVVASVSHEFRTPLNAIDGLAALLGARTDGPLTAEQEKQVALIRQSAASLTAMVNDMLDLSRVDAGKAPLRVVHFTVGTLFAALRGLFRAVHANPAVALEFDPAHASMTLDTDEGRVAQILRNLVANALKFTEHGHVRVSAMPLGDGRVVFTVQDTGIGIAPEDQPRVFEEFAQVSGPLQQRTRGSGLGLPLSRGLAVLLGGTLTLTSEVGRGSLFTLTIPASLAAAGGS